MTGAALRWLRPVPADRRGRRATVLVAGLVLYGISDTAILQARLGVVPWDVLHQGLSRTLGGAVGTWSIVVGVLVLLAWIPLRERPGVGTLANVVLVGGTIDVTLLVLPAPHALAVRVAFLVAGILANGLSTGMYVGADLGPGPRDGLMTGLAARGHSVHVVRTGIELAVLAVGWGLGGDVGWGTLAYAATIGPLARFFLPALRITARTDAPPISTG